MSEFKVGDKVRIKNDLVPGQRYGGVFMLGGLMAAERGHEGEIDFIYEEANAACVEGCSFIWSFEMLEHVEEVEEKEVPGRPVAKKAKVENLKHLLDLVSLNPNLPVLPIVDADCVASDDYGYWLASIGSVEVTKILDDINYCKDGRFYREDDFDEIVEDLVSESDDPLDEEEAEDIVKNYPWRKVILVYIIPG